MKKRILLSLLGVAGLMTITSCEIDKSTQTPDISETIPSTTVPPSTTPDAPNVPTLPTEYTGYYANMTNNLGTTFKSTLNQIISTNLKTSSYSNAWKILEEADAYDNNNIECFYSGVVIPKTSRSGSGASGLNWNREHVWAKSHGFGNETSNYAYYDAFHLHATEEGINSKRSNLPFDDVNDGSSDKYGNSWNSKAFEPRDEVKGDVARSLFYMVVRYDDRLLDLELEDNLTSTASKEPTLGKLSTLVKWAYEDPVSEAEIKRNEIVYSYQGNRNPFIDNPEFIYYLYTEESNDLGITLDNLMEHIYNGTSGDGNTNPENPDNTNQAVKNVINLINAIGTVNANSKSAIDAAYAAYNALTDSEKSLVTNYQTLVDANNAYNSIYGGEFKYKESFNNVLNGEGYTANVSFTLGSVKWIASYAYRDSDFRLGNKNVITLESKYQIDGASSDGAYLQASFTDITSITFNATNKYGTINKAYLMYSADGGNTFELLKDFGSITAATTLNASWNDAKSGIFALVITGSKPRLVLSDVLVK